MDVNRHWFTVRSVLNVWYTPSTFNLSGLGEGIRYLISLFLISSRKTRNMRKNLNFSIWVSWSCTQWLRSSPKYCICWTDIRRELSTQRNVFWARKFRSFRPQLDGTFFQLAVHYRLNSHPYQVSRNHCQFHWHGVFVFWY